MTIKVNNNVIRELNIFAKCDVPKKQVLDYYKDFIKNMNNLMMHEFSK